MSRFTQYIGLTSEAEEFVRDAKVITRFNGTTGVFGEPVEFRLFSKQYKDHAGIPYDVCFVEVEQATVWSSGPMIYTCLVCTSNGEIMFKWDEDTFK